jgi:hypothetical protein
MPGIERRKLWDTLRLVQINISDPLPYQLETDDLIQEVSKKKLSIEKIRDKAIANDPTAKAMLEQLNNQTAERIMFDAPSRYLDNLLYFMENRFAFLPEVRGFTPPPPGYEIDLTTLRSSKPGAIVRAATEWTAQSASAFTEAIDIIKSGKYFGPHLPFNPVDRALRKGHTFDEGNQPRLDLMEEERQRILRRSRWRHDYYDHYNFEINPYEHLDSTKSYYVHAADIAGRIASHLLEAESLFTIAQNFEYVMYNGNALEKKGRSKLSGNIENSVTEVLARPKKKLREGYSKRRKMKGDPLH